MYSVEFYEDNIWKIYSTHTAQVDAEAAKERAINRDNISEENIRITEN